jgi:hypothetical protein
MSDKHLAFIVSETSVSFAEVLRSSGVLLKQAVIQFTSSDIQSIKDSVANFLQSNAIENSNYEDVTLAFCSSDQALFPLAIFNEVGAEVLANAVFESEFEKEELDFNRIMEHSMVNVYRVPLWVKSFFVMRFPTITIQHERTMLTRFTLLENAFKPKVTLMYDQDHFGIVVTRHNELVFSNSYRYQSSEDVVYYLQFAIAKLNIQDSTLDVHNFYTSEDSKASSEEVNDILNRLQIQPKLNRVSSEFFHKIQPKCV